MDTNSCSSSICGKYSVRDIDEIILNIKNEVLDISFRQIRDLHKGKICKDHDKIEKLLKYSNILKKTKEQSLNGQEVCLNSEDIQCLIEKIKGIVGVICKPQKTDITIDSSKEEEWVMDYPYCRSYEQWEKWTKFICGKLKLEISLKEKRNNLAFEITRNIITPNVLLTLSANKEAKGLNIEINRTDTEINAEHSILLEEITAFNLSKKEYQKLLKDHKMSYDMVKTIYDEGLAIKVTDEGAYLKTYMDEYNLSDIEGKIDPTYLKKFGRKTSVNKKDLLQDYK